MSDAEKTTIIGAAPGGYGYNDDWDDEASRRRKRNRIIALVVAGILLIAGAIAIGIALTSGGGGNNTPTVTQVTVPDLTGLSQEEATAKIKAAGLTLGTISRETSTDAEKDKVLSSDPPGGSKADKQAPVTLVIGSGPNTVAVPNVVDLDQAAAIAQLKSAGFTGSISTDQVDNLAPKGTVVAIDPAAGSQAAPDVAIRLGVSSGTIPLPDVRGLTQAAAREQLVAAGIDNGNIEATNAESDTVAPGSVVGTDPGPRSPVGSGDVITLLVAVAIPTQAPPTTTTPTSPSATTPTSSPTTSVPSSGSAGG
jgi:serine/threonine-protein kinase